MSKFLLVVARGPNAQEEVNWLVYVCASPTCDRQLSMKNGCSFIVHCTMLQITPLSKPSSLLVWRDVCVAQVLWPPQGSSYDHARVERVQQLI